MRSKNSSVVEKKGVQEGLEKAWKGASRRVGGRFFLKLSTRIRERVVQKSRTWKRKRGSVQRKDWVFTRPRVNYKGTRSLGARKL